MSFSLAKFLNHTLTDDGLPLHWGAADDHGAPFRGPAPLYKKMEELQAVKVVADAHAEFFDTQDPQQMRRYKHVIECAAAGWYVILYINRFWQDGTKHYVEWLAKYAQHDPRRLAGLGLTVPALPPAGGLT